LEVLTRQQARNVPKVRLISNDTNEVVSTDVALRLAEDQGLDLVIVSDKSVPFVVRILDLKKLEYEKRKEKKKQVVSELKEVQFKVNIADHDLETKVNHIKKFLERGDKVKITVRLKGREREHPERAQDVIKRVTALVPCKVTRMPGAALLEPIK